MKNLWKDNNNNTYTLAGYTVFCNCNRNLEYLIAKYRKLKGGE